MADFHVFHTSEMAPVDRGGGVRSYPLVGENVGAERLLTGMTVIPPGGAIPLHTHSSEESVVILEGRAVCEVAGQRFDVGQYDATYIRAGVPHRFLNAGDGELRILWIYSDIHTTRTFVASGRTVGNLEPLAER